MQTVEEYLAAGRTITICPPVYLVPITGAAPLDSGMGDRKAPERDRKACAALAKARKRPDKVRESRGRETLALLEANERRRQKHMADVAKYTDLFNRGRSVEELARMRGCCYKTMRNMLHAAGYDTSKKAAPKAAKPPKPPKTRRNDKLQARYAEILAVHNEGLSVKQICARLACHARTARKVIRAAGMKPHQPIKKKTVTVAESALGAEVARLYAMGATSRQLAKMFRLGKSTVVKIVRQRGGEVREPNYIGCHIQLEMFEVA